MKLGAISKKTKGLKMMTDNDVKKQNIIIWKNVTFYINKKLCEFKP